MKVILFNENFHALKNFLKNQKINHSDVKVRFIQIKTVPLLLVRKNQRLIFLDAINNNMKRMEKIKQDTINNPPCFKDKYICLK